MFQKNRETVEIGNMKKRVLKKLLCLIFILLMPSFLGGMDFGDIRMQTYYHPMRTKEEFYSLYRENLHGREDNYNANLLWLQYALTAPFNHPVKALAKIESEAQWKEYRMLFLFQVHFLMMQNYIYLAELYDKPHILFFNPPFAKELDEGFLMSKVYYQEAQTHLKEAQKLMELAWTGRDSMPLSLGGELDRWADRMYRLKNPQIYHEMDYTRELAKRLSQVDEKIQKLQSLIKTTPISE